ncbi:MAG: S8/S53 family peptidase [Oscillochloris sp.]|nr:S8/S53 family peptidase [Oscillochloris sp.]
MTFLVEHGRGVSPQVLTERLQSMLQSGGPLLGSSVAGSDALLSGHELRAPKETHSFAHLNEEVVAELNLAQHRRPSAEAFSLISVPLKSSDSGRGLMDLVTTINRAIAEGQWQIDLGEGVQLRACAPNWLITPTPWVAGGGGPGSLPTPLRPGDLPTANNGQPGELPFQIKVRALGQMPPTQTSRPVEVIILDTLPPERQISAAEQRWGAKHPLLCSLLSPGRLTRIAHDDPAWQIRLPKRHEVQVAGHDYVMSDHGLFVAGVIHSIAPQARLRLIEVLNAYGIGYVESIARVLSQLAQECIGDQTPPMVINCSLTIMAPLAGHWVPDPTRDDDLEDVTLFQAGRALAGRNPADLSAEEQAILAQIDLLALAFEWVCMAARHQQILVVAAAGNDAQATGVRPQARCPAAFATVVGVGALDKHDRWASYSNRADRQAQQGLATFGGEVAPPPVRSQGRRIRPALAGESVLGVYIGDFPRMRPRRHNNVNGWAWWAGTSFAAPIVSGAVAYMVGAGLAANPVEAHRQLVAANDGLTCDGDEILQAKQG